MFNQALLNDPELLEFEIELHPFGKLTKREMKKVYFYFLRWNVAYSAYTGKGEMLDRLALSALNNEANISFPDREFIKQHVFGRGYNREFTAEFEKKWEMIEKTGKSLAMKGDKSKQYTIALEPEPVDLTNVPIEREKL